MTATEEAQLAADFEALARRLYRTNDGPRIIHEIVHELPCPRRVMDSRHDKGMWAQEATSRGSYN